LYLDTKPIKIKKHTKPIKIKKAQTHKNQKKHTKNKIFLFDRGTFGIGNKNDIAIDYKLE